MMPTTPPTTQVRIDVLDCHRDARGVVFEPLAADEIARHRNVHVVITAPGAVRGNHRHVRGSETATVLGPALIRYREGGEVRDVEVPAGEAWRFVFPPEVAHAFKNIGEEPFVLTSFNTEEHDPVAPDAVRDVLIEA
jgi:dTDP-4-dehydrorhamnose 3,5-epimerase-like enzyme